MDIPVEIHCLPPKPGARGPMEDAQGSVEEVPLEVQGLPDFEGAHSLLDALLAHNLPGLVVRDIRRLARVSKAWSKTVDAEECWRLAVSALAIVTFSVAAASHARGSPVLN